MRRRHRRENEVLKMLMQAVAGVAACIVALILFFAFIWWRGQHTYPQTDEEVAAQMQREQAEPLVIETPEPATTGTIRVFDYDGCCIYAYYGKIKINNDGTDGKEIDVICEGYLEGYEQHKEPGYTGESKADNERGIHTQPE